MIYKYNNVIGLQIMAKHKNWHGATRKRLLKKKLKEQKKD